jgi:hypothetical protein
MATMTQPAPGLRVKKTTFTEVVPAENGQNDARASRFYARPWEDVVNDENLDWSEHLVRVYRAGEKWERGAAPVDNVFNAPFSEEDIRARFGGGNFLLWMLGPPKKHNLVAKWQVPLEGTPLMNSTPRNGYGTASGSDSVAIEAMRMYANPQFMQLQMDAMRTAMITAIEMVKGQIPQAQDPLQTLRNAKEILGVGTPVANPMDDIYKQLMTALVQKLLNPPETNSFDATLELVNKIKSAGLFGGVPKADLASTFAANVPMLADRFVAGLESMRMRAEAEERTVRMQRGEMRPGDPNVITVENQAPAQSAAPSPPNGAAPSSASSAVTVTPEVAKAIIAQSHLHRLVAGIKQPDSTGQDMYDYLRNAWPEVLDELSKMSPAILLGFFKSRELQNTYFGCDILFQVGEDPRLPKMIEDFLRIAKENAPPAEKVANGAVV